MKGRLIGISGYIVKARLPEAGIYDRVLVGERELTGEIIKISGEDVIIQVYEDTRGLGTGEKVESLKKPLTAFLGPGLMGNIFDGLQRPLEKIVEEEGSFFAGQAVQHFDQLKQKFRFTPLKNEGDSVSRGEAVGYFTDKGFKHYVFADTGSGKLKEITEGEFLPESPVAELENGTEIYSYTQQPVRIPLVSGEKQILKEPIITGQRVIDFFFPLMKGGVSIIPGGFGTGKTVLEQSIAKYADVDIVLYVGCGERGNEIAEMIEEFTTIKDEREDKLLRDRTVFVVNTSNMPVAARESSIYMAVCAGEYYRRMGYHVLLLADSISRWAEALKEISSSLEEMPGEEGYPTYMSSRIASYVERAGAVKTSVEDKTGSLSMVLSVSPPGADFAEPVTQTLLQNSGIFLMLDRELAYARHYPAINWTQSYSNYRDDLEDYYRQNVAEEWQELRRKCLQILKQEQELMEIRQIVGDEGMKDEDKEIIKLADKIKTEFLMQDSFSEDAYCPLQKTYEKIKNILGEK